MAVDELVFHGLLGDLFPGLNPEREMDLTLKQCCEQACETLKLQPHPTFVLKCVQTEELLQIRHCVFVMGPPGSGLWLGSILLRLPVTSFYS